MVVLEGPNAERLALRDAIAEQTRVVADESRLHATIPALQKRIQELERDKSGLEKETAALPAKGNEAAVKAHEEATRQVQRLKDAIAAAERRTQELAELKNELARQLRALDAWHAQLQARFQGLLDAPTWELLRFVPGHGAAGAVDTLETESRRRSTLLRQQGIGACEGAQRATGNSNEGLTALEARLAEQTKILGTDEANVKKRADLTKKLAGVDQLLERQKKELVRAQEAVEKRRSAQESRLRDYEAVFATLVAEEQALLRLYQPLRERIAGDSRLAHLSFTVRRFVDLDAWTARGEALLDLRRPPFAGRGTLDQAARKLLLQAWRTGTPADAKCSMEQFLAAYAAPAAGALAQGVTPQELGEWFFSTDHITVRYSIQYEGVEVAQLSPGAKGVVLLTLYLALDQSDTRPLIIDQPEENLDPRSVFSDLVPFFRDASLRRQVIMVTHNANLVVNTDSDQVIVAHAERQSPVGLPTIRYFAGALEDASIRTEVCRLLEGGEEAFKKRGRRYGVVG